jgi:hypothetical protein
MGCDGPYCARTTEGDQVRDEVLGRNRVSTDIRKTPRPAGERPDDIARNGIVEGQLARPLRVRPVFDRPGRAGKSISHGEEAGSPLLVVEDPAVAAVYVASKALVRQEIARQLANVRIIEKLDRLAFGAAQCQRIEIIEQGGRERVVSSGASRHLIACKNTHRGAEGQGRLPRPASSRGPAMRSVAVQIHVRTRDRRWQGC